MLTYTLFLARKIYTFNETFSFFTKSLPTLFFPNYAKLPSCKAKTKTSYIGDTIFFTIVDMVWITLRSTKSSTNTTHFFIIGTSLSIESVIDTILFYIPITTGHVNNCEKCCVFKVVENIWFFYFFNGPVGSWSLTTHPNCNKQRAWLKNFSP